MTAEVTRLPGGLIVASDSMDHLETVSLGVWVDVGTRHEAAELNGVAHLLEHMAFKGTARRSAYDIAAEIEAVGGHLNAYTSRECTAYYAKVLAADAPLAIDIIADILQFPAFDEEEMNRERAVVLQEIGQALDTPDDLVFDYFQEVAYPDQALGRPVLGSAEIVQGLGRGALRDYMGQHYGPPRMILTAAGKIDHADLVALGGAAFQALQESGPREIEPGRYAGGERRESKDLEQAHLLMGFESVGLLDPDYYAANLLSTLFGGGMSSRLFQEVREKRGLVYSVYSFNSSYLDGGDFGIYAGTGAAEVTELVPVICDELCRLAEDITDEEVERAAIQMKASLVMSREGPSARCEQLAQQILVHGRPFSVAETLGKIDAVTPAAVRSLARRLTASPLSLACLGPIDRVESYDRISARLQ